MPQVLSPPLTALPDLDGQLASAGYAVLDAQGLAALAGVDLQALRAWCPLWDDLPPDRFLKDGGRYRRRRHGSFIVDAQGALHAVPHRAHWQPLAYNALHGGIERWFEPLPQRLLQDPAWARLLSALAQCAGLLRGGAPEPWYVEGPSVPHRHHRWHRAGLRRKVRTAMAWTWWW